VVEGRRGDVKVGLGEGKSKKQAEQAAALQALEQIDKVSLCMSGEE